MMTDKYIGNLGRQDSEFDNTLAENAEYQPAPPRRVNWWRVLGVIACAVPWGLIYVAYRAVHHFMLHAH